MAIECRMLEEEKAMLKGQIEGITAKSVEAFECQEAMFELCEQLQRKLK